MLFHMWPSITTATIFNPSRDMATSYHCPARPWSSQVWPPSRLLHMWPFKAVTTTVEPSADMAMPVQVNWELRPCFSVQLAPPSLLVQRTPSFTRATILEPSDEMARSAQALELGAWLGTQVEAATLSKLSRERTVKGNMETKRRVFKRETLEP